MGDAAEEIVEGSWSDSIEDEGLRESLSGYESQEKVFEAIGYTPPEAGDPADWREGLPEDLKKTAERFTSSEDALRSIVALQKRDGQVRVPGKDSTDDDRSAYYKAIGVPETAEGYEFKLAEGEESTPEIEATNKVWAERMHETKTSVESFNKFVGWMKEDVAEMEAAKVAANEAFFKASEDALKAEWKGDHEKNLAYANRAFSETAERSGLNVKEVGEMKLEDGRFVHDHPFYSKMFSTIGREMAEGGLGPVLTENEKDTATEAIDAVQKEIAAAQAEGNSKKADKLYARKQAMIAKRDGDRPIVGAN